MSQLNKSVKDSTMTQLQGIKNFIYIGIMSGELDTEMSIVELSTKIDQLMELKIESYNSKMRNMKRSGQEDDMFR